MTGGGEPSPPIITEKAYDDTGQDSQKLMVCTVKESEKWQKSKRSSSVIFYLKRYIKI